MSTQHTPGPWFFDGETDEITCEKRDGMAAIAKVETGWNEQFESEQQANARLIATAPLLLTELKKARAYIAEHHTSFVETVTNQHTKLIDDAEDLMAAESGQDLLDGIDGVIANAEGKQCPT